MREWALKMVADIRRLHRENRDAKVAGIKLAASVAGDYDKLSSHGYLVSECILGKLNVLKRAPKKNQAAVDINQAITKMERRVASVEATTRFLKYSAGRSGKQKR